MHHQFYACFMRLINKGVESVRNNNQLHSSSDAGDQCGQPCEILAFLDDLLLPSENVESGLEMLEIIFKKIKS